MKIYLGAVVDGVFLTDTAEELLKRKEVLKVPVMMGITNHEFGWILPQVTHTFRIFRHNILSLCNISIAPIILFYSGIQSSDHSFLKGAGVVFFIFKDLYFILN